MPIIAWILLLFYFIYLIIFLRLYYKSLSIRKDNLDKFFNDLSKGA